MHGQVGTVLLRNDFAKTAAKVRSCCRHTTVLLQAVCGRSAIEMRLTLTEPQQLCAIGKNDA